MLLAKAGEDAAAGDLSFGCRGKSVFGVHPLRLRGCEKTQPLACHSDRVSCLGPCPLMSTTGLIH